MNSQKHRAPILRALPVVIGLSLSFFLSGFRNEQPASAEELATEVNAIAVSGNEVYVGGLFTSIGNISANNIARYNLATGAWSPLGGGTNNVVAAIAVSGSDVYVGGRFTNAVNPGGANVPVTCVVRWSNATNTWNPLGASGVNQNGVNGDVSALAIGGGFVYVGGDFNTARNSGSNTFSVGSVARWNGSSWSTLGSGGSATGNGVSSPGLAQVYAIATSGSDVYVAGSFTRANNSNSSNISTNCIARWNSGTGLWSALGGGSGAGANGVNGDVLALAVSGSDLYIGGNFTSVYNNLNAGIAVGHIARWNGASWATLGTGTGTAGNGVAGTVFALAVGQGFLYAGGDFTAAYNGSGGGIGASSVSANCIARWNGSSWSAMGASSGSTGNGMNAQVSAIATSSGDAYAGGEFTNAYNSGSNRVTVGGIARWNGAQWSAFGSGSTGGGGTVTTVSAASLSGAEVSPESIATAYGPNLATVTQAATTTPLPVSLGGTTVRVRDSAGTERSAPLFFVSPLQVNFQVPAGTAGGGATVTIAAADGRVSTGGVQIAAVSPALFTANANGQGVAAATVFRLKGNGAQSYEPVARFDSAQNRFVAVPIDLGPTTDQVFLVLNGSGVRYRSNLAAATARIGGTSSEVLYAGPQGGFAGLDQMNLRVPRSLAGRGEVDVMLVVDGKPANAVKMSIK
jgi:uncharacterized protein (TIGR03437 family)